jgi:hypothetical protein
MHAACALSLSPNDPVRTVFDRDGCVNSTKP